MRNVGLTMMYLSTIAVKHRNGLSLHHLLMCNVVVCNGDRSFVGIFPMKVIRHKCARKENDKQRTRPIEGRTVDVIGGRPECPEELDLHQLSNAKSK